MAAQGNVTLRLTMSGDNSVAARLDQLKGKTNNFDKPIEIKIGLNDKEAQTKIGSIFHELEALNRTRGTIQMKFPDYATAVAQLEMLKAKTDAIDGRVIKERIKISGTGEALLEFSALTKAAESIGNGNGGGGNNKGIFSRLFSGGGSSGGGAGGAFSGPLQGISGVGSGASAGAIEALTSPVGAGAAALALPFIGTGVSGAALGVAGAGLAGLGVAGAMGAGTSTPQDLAKAQDSLHSAQLRVIADQNRLNDLQHSGTATATQLATAHATLATAENAVTNAQNKLDKLPPQATKSQQAAQSAFQDLAANAKQSLSTIGASFAPVMVTIFNTADSTLKKLVPVFAGAEKAISGPFKQVGVILATSLGSPAVVTAVKSLATSFGEFLSAFAPQIPGIINAFANGINGMATAFTDHPGMIQGMASILAFLFKIPGFVGGALGSLTRVTSWLISGLPHAVSIGLDATREFFINIGHGIETAWDAVWNNVTGTASAGAGVLSSFWTTITGPFRAGYNFVVGIFNDIKNFVTASFDQWWATNGEAVIAIWNRIWTKVKQIATAIWDGILFELKGFFAVIGAIFEVGKALILGVWGAIWPLVKAVFQAAWSVITYAVQAGWIIIRTTFQTGAAMVTLVWRTAWAIIKLVVQQAWSLIKTVVKIGWDVIIGLFSAFINILTGRWGAAWNNIRNMFTQVWNAMRSYLQGSLTRMWNTIVSTWGNVFRFFGTVPGRILRAIGSLAGLLVGVGRNVIGGLFNGIRQALSNVGNWVKQNIADPIINAVKHFFGVRSPSTVMASIGGHLIGGLIKGLLHDPGAVIGKIFGGWAPALGSMLGKGFISLTKLPGKALHALMGLGSKVLSSIFGGGGSAFGGGTFGVSKWLGVVQEALLLNGLPLNLASQVLHQISTESGGNPGAINLTDINAQHGDPSRGLLQTIGSTFAAYHIPGTSGNIYDPLANVAAAINYARHTYGPSLMSGGMGLGSGHGYALGTNNAARGWAVVGERGPELAFFNGGEKVVANNRIGSRSGGGNNYSITVNVGGPGLVNKREVGRVIVDHIQEYERGSGKGWRASS